MSAPEKTEVLATIDKLLRNARTSLLRIDFLTVTGDQLQMIASGLDMAALLLQIEERKATEKIAQKPEGADWAKAVMTERMQRPRGIVNGHTMADLVAFEDDVKAAQPGTMVDTTA